MTLYKSCSGWFKCYLSLLAILDSIISNCTATSVDGGTLVLKVFQEGLTIAHTAAEELVSDSTGHDNIEDEVTPPLSAITYSLGKEREHRVNIERIREHRVNIERI